MSPESLQSWNLDDIKHDMVTESEYTTEFPQAPEDMEISSDVEPESMETYVSESAVNID